jgi:hypothetical protein
VVGTIMVPSAADSVEPLKLEFERLKFDRCRRYRSARQRRQFEWGPRSNPRGIPAINFMLRI